MINENHNREFRIMHLNWLRETQRVTAQILKDFDDDDRIYLTRACYTIEDYRKAYEDWS
jgi:hypothetical protein